MFTANFHGLAQIICCLICAFCVYAGPQNRLVSPIEKPRIVVYKKDRKLELYSDRTLVRTYRVGLGFSPVVDKQREGDGATPEGDFYIFVKNNKSAYYLSLGVSYPNTEDEFVDVVNRDAGDDRGRADDDAEPHLDDDEAEI